MWFKPIVAHMSITFSTLATCHSSQNDAGTEYTYMYRELRRKFVRVNKDTAKMTHTKMALIKRDLSSSIYMTNHSLLPMFSSRLLLPNQQPQLNINP